MVTTGKYTPLWLLLAYDFKASAQEGTLPEDFYWQKNTDKGMISFADFEE